MIGGEKEVFLSTYESRDVFCGKVVVKAIKKPRLFFFFFSGGAFGERAANDRAEDTTTMPLRLDIKRKLVQRSDRVKGVELHPVEPWILANLYSGNVFIWNHATNSLVKSFDVTELPVRTAKWCLRKQWIVCGSDDMFI